jgi:NAD(P)-dependent dehydrogenase (short-subunit alcohol dehydrogenase family)
MDLTNASAIVTGGAGGFGFATVRRLAQKGAKALRVRAMRSATSENAVHAKFTPTLKTASNLRARSRREALRLWAVGVGCSG